ncbi:hypothetical protein GEMRC1_009257 [Eukaryota sp. GEM-RC1]
MSEWTLLCYKHSFSSGPKKEHTVSHQYDVMIQDHTCQFKGFSPNPNHQFDEEGFSILSVADNFIDELTIVEEKVDVTRVLDVKKQGFGPLVGATLVYGPHKVIFYIAKQVFGAFYPGEPNLSFEKNYSSQMEPDVVFVQVLPSYYFSGVFILCSDGSVMCVQTLS